jgi:F-type H+-transporting ATPase subunit b
MRRPLLVVFVLLLGVVTAAALSAPVHAAAEPAHDKKADAHADKKGDGHGDAHGSDDDGGVFGKALDLAIWTILVFLILLMVLGKFAWGPMMEGLKRREESIRAAIDEAQKAKEEAARMRQEMQAEMAKVRDSQQKLIEEARRDAERLKEEMKTEAQAQITAERDRLRKEITTATDQALQDLWQRTARLATEVSAKAIRKNLAEDDHRRLVDEALRELKVAPDGNKG